MTDLAARIRDANTRLLVDADLSAVEAFFTPGYRVHLTGRELTGGHAVVRRILGALHSAFDELTVEVEVLTAAGDRIAWQRTIRGVHRERYKGFPGTGRRLVWRDMATSRFEGDRIAEEWVISDLAEQLLLARKRR